MNIVTRQQIVSNYFCKGLQTPDVFFIFYLFLITYLFFIISDGSCVFQENVEKQISVEEDTPPGEMTPDKTYSKHFSHPTPRHAEL